MKSRKELENDTIGR